jgi:hypothetical protein
MAREEAEPPRQPWLPRLEGAVKLPDREDIEAVCTLVGVVGQHAIAVVVGGGLCELARTMDVAASHVEPILLHPRWARIAYAQAQPALLSRRAREWNKITEAYVAMRDG